MNESDDNVIDLSVYRSRRRLPRRHAVFYVTDEGRWQSLFARLPYVELDEIRNPMLLRAKLLLKKPDLVLIESKLSWAEPIDMIRELDQSLGAPIVMICDEGHSTRNSLFLKRAFAAGLQDALFSPLREDELCETINVLLKLRRRALGRY